MFICSGEGNARPGAPDSPMVRRYRYPRRAQYAFATGSSPVYPLSNLATSTTALFPSMPLPYLPILVNCQRVGYRRSTYRGLADVDVGQTHHWRWMCSKAPRDRPRNELSCVRGGMGVQIYYTHCTPEMILLRLLRILLSVASCYKILLTSPHQSGSLGTP